ncbi:CBS domain-containing protein [Bdellovibrio bacteriovorus]|uniref:CBS domain-containing protein n=1 Tax=Bdellovibrio bacteriovorus TaxID=959 RepID=A0A161PDM8_BDEBC|nr:CBS domain-containing protein [Bdellovibrio bacteriovorus]KYG68334.1 CBS domain-containing protein [Bdellovibrio bacteriovorus]
MKLVLKNHISRKLITVPKTATAAEAQRLMANYWIRHLPVMDEEDDYIVGMLSDRDLMRASSVEVTVDKIMTSPIKTFDIDTPIDDVVEAMIEEKVSAFLITKEDEVVGIVTTEDMLVVLHQVLKKEDTSTWNLSEILVNPALQRAAYLVGQAGI